MIKVKNPNTFNGKPSARVEAIIAEDQYSSNGRVYTLEPGEEKSFPDYVAEKLLKLYGFLTDEGQDDAPAPQIDVVDEPKVSKGEGLEGIAGLGKKSIEKLKEAGVDTKEKFENLKKETLSKIVGPLVASRFK